jgi:flagellar hook-length control protein FliK
VPHAASAGTRINLAATEAVANVPQPKATGARVAVAAMHALADVPQRAPAGARIVAPQAGRVDQEASLTTSDEPLVKAPQIASPLTDAVVQLALSGLEAAVKAMPAQISAAHSAIPAKRSGDTEPTASLPELKLSTATALPPIQPIAAAFEALRPLEAASIGTPSVPQPLDASELVIERQLDMAHEGEWLDQLARDITRSAGSDNSPLRFRLNPENLGSLRVEISQDRNGAAVRLTTDTEAARTIIAEAQPRLIAEARAQGIRISEAHVDLGGQTASGDPRRQNPAFEEAPLRTARSLQEHGEGDGKPTPGRSERYA